MTQFDVRCSECGESGTVGRMDLDESDKCYYCRAEEEAIPTPTRPEPTKKELLEVLEGIIELAQSGYGHSSAIFSEEQHHVERLRAARRVIAAAKGVA